MGNFAQSVFRFFFVAINVILLLGGIASLAGGIYLAVAPDHALSFTEIGAVGLGQTGLVRTGGYLLIGAGCGAIFIALLGLLAARKESACLYVTYAVIMMIILGVELAALIVGIIYKQQWEYRLKTAVQEQITLKFDGRKDTNDKFTAAINTFQMELQCCGIYNASDFYSATNWNRTTSSGQMMLVPPSCCMNYGQSNTTSCTVMPTDENSYASKGCWMEIEDLMNRYTLILIIIAAVTFVIELFLITFSICLVGKIKSGYSLDKK